jgi:hypothetical protein
LSWKGDKPHCEDALMSFGRLIIILGIVLVVLGVLWPWITKLGLGRLPGDIVIERENFLLYIPLVTRVAHISSFAKKFCRPRSDPR